MAVDCACGKGHQIIAGSPQVALCQGKWWNLKCLFRVKEPKFPAVIDKLYKANKEIMSMRSKIVRMKRAIRSKPCVSCGMPAGNRFMVIDDEIVCGACGKQFENFQILRAT
jgi:rubredoxin